MSVIDNFVEILASREEVAEENTPEIVEKRHEAKIAHVHNEFEGASSLKKILDDLEKAANDSVSIGNERATYELENAHSKITQLVSDFISGE